MPPRERHERRKNWTDPRLTCYATSTIAPEAYEILNGLCLSQKAVRAFKALKPERQVEVARRVVRLGSCPDVVVLPLLVSTRPADLNYDGRQSWVSILLEEWDAVSNGNRDQCAQELDEAERSLLSLSLEVMSACGYVGRLLSNSRIVDHLERKHRPELAVLRSALSSGARSAARKGLRMTPIGSYRARG